MFLTASLIADVKTLIPYAGQINYDSDGMKSSKNKADFYGAYASIGNLGYLIEADVSHMDTTYKDANLTKLNQNEITLTFAKYYTNFMLKIGDHYVSTNDKQLGDGNILMLAAAGYTDLGSNKITAGIEGYYSHYNQGHDENYTAKPITIFQITPYLSFYSAINKELGNTLLVKANYQIATDYLTKNYLSYELSDTIYYQRLFVTLGGYIGQMRTGVKDSGMTVFNSLDKMKKGYSMKAGYYLTKDAVISLSFCQNFYEEYGFTENGISSLGVATIGYSF